MKYVKPLTEAEQITLREAWKDLYDKPRAGRPPIYTPEEQQRLRELVDGEPRQLKGAQAQLEAETGKGACTRTSSRALKKNGGYVWKRCRRLLKARRDPEAFEQAEKVLSGLQQFDQEGQLELFYFDESGVSVTPVVPYAWQPIRQTLELPAFSRQRVTVLGFMNRDNEVFHTAVEGTVDSARVVAAIEAFIAWRDSETPTVLVLDNASIHTSAAALERRDAWLAQGLIPFFLPTYSPELNLIEIFWRKLKYEWLPFSTYLSFAALKPALAEIFDNIRSKIPDNFCLGT